MRSHYRGYRHPHTTQELRYNCAPEHAPYVRAKRLNIPNAWDDLWVSQGKNQSWKRKRKTQYHQEDTSDWGWHEFVWDMYGDDQYMIYRNIFDQIERGGYWYDRKGVHLRWYGPELPK